MMDRYSITRGMYNLFDHRIVVKNLADGSLFMHEYYHHIQNISTVLGGERLNLVIQFLAHTMNLTSNHAPINLPIHRWYTKGLKDGFASPALQRRLENIVFHQEEWMYLDKSGYRLKFFQETECFDEFFAIVENKQKESIEPYLLRRMSGLIVGFPIGGLTVTESGAYALELWHSETFDTNIFSEINEENYEYLIIIDLMYHLLGDYKLAFLATFLFCDLAMIVATPSMGFVLLYTEAKNQFTKGESEDSLISWYNTMYEKYQDLIHSSIEHEKDIITGIRANMSRNGSEDEKMIAYQLNLLEKGFQIRLKDKLDITERLLSKRPEDIEYLMKKFPPSYIETTDDGMIRYNSEEDVMSAELLRASYHLYLGFCWNPNHLIENDEVLHVSKLTESSFLFNLKVENGNVDAFGHMLSILGLQNSTIHILPKP